MTNPVSVNGYAVSVGTAPNIGMIPFVAPFSPSPSNIVGPNGPFKIGQLWVDESSGSSFQLVGLSSSNGVVSASWIALGVEATTLSVVGTTNQIGVSTFANISTISLTNGISIGSFQATSPPVGGILMPGQLSVGATQINQPAQVYIDSTGKTYGIDVTGTMTSVDGNSHMFGIVSVNTLSPSGVASLVAGIDSTPNLIAASAQTISIGAAFYGTMRSLSNVGTITNMAVFYADAGDLIGAGTITNSYGGYFNQPAAGANKIAVYTDNMVVGDPTAVPLTNGITVPLGTSFFKLITTGPGSANSVSTSFGQIVLGTPKQNTLLFDMIVNVCIIVSAATNATITFGISSSPTPTAVTQVPTFSTATQLIFNFTYYLPYIYYLVVNTTGTITVDSVTTSATGV